MDARSVDDTSRAAADALWGPGNWLVCDPCPANDGGRLVHARDYHDNFERPTGVVVVYRDQPPYCAEPFREEHHTRFLPWLCELPVGHGGRHGIPRFEKWGPEPV